MRFDRTDRFKSDYQRLSTLERELFKGAVRDFNAACDPIAESRDPSQWPAHLRIKPVVNATGVFEMTWSFSGPDGRATWEWITVSDREGMEHPAVRWRRLGDHRIFSEP